MTVKLRLSMFRVPAVSGQYRLSAVSIGPVIQGQVLLFDGNHGGALALVEAATLTAIRTAAASGAALAPGRCRRWARRRPRLRSCKMPRR